MGKSNEEKKQEKETGRLMGKVNGNDIIKIVDLMTRGDRKILIPYFAWIIGNISLIILFIYSNKYKLYIYPFYILISFFPMNLIFIVVYWRKIIYFIKRFKK